MICKDLDNEYLELMSHPLIEAFIYRKWMDIRAWYILNWFAYFVPLLILGVMVGYKATDVDNCWKFWTGWSITVLWVVYIIGRETVHWATLGRSYIQISTIQMDNIMDWAVVSSTSVYLVSILIDKEIAFNAGYDASIVVGKIRDAKAKNYGFDAQTGKYVDMVANCLLYTSDAADE